MAKAPKKPDEIFAAFSEDLKGAFGEALVSIILFGSGATGEYIPGKSDLNFLVVLTDVSPVSLRKASPVVARWRRRTVNTPLFMTREYIKSSLDSYPIEFLDMQANYKLVHGEDVLRGLQFRLGDIRVQCERELKGKALHLRQAYLEAGDHPKILRKIIAGTITAFTSLFQGLLYLANKPIPRTKEEIVTSVSQQYGLNEGVFQKLLAIRGGQIKISATETIELFAKYLSEIDALSDAVDQLTLSTEES